MAAYIDRSDPVVRHGRRDDLAGAVDPVAMAKHPQQTWPGATGMTTPDWKTGSERNHLVVKTIAP